MNPGIVGYLVGLAFAIFWLRTGAGAVGGNAGTAILIVGGLVIAGAAWLIWRRRNQRTPGARFRLAYYLIAVAAEIAAMNVAVLLLPAALLRAYQAPVIGAIVGLHFIGLWAATNMRRFLWLSGGMTALNLAALALPPTNLPAAVAGLGSAAALVATVAA